MFGNQISACLIVTACLLSSLDAFSVPRSSSTSSVSSSSSAAAAAAAAAAASKVRSYSVRQYASSVDIENDGETAVNGNNNDVEEVSINNNNNINSRYDQVFQDVGLDKNQLKQVPNMPMKRVLSPNDVFCNRELKLSGIRAIGFDMDYTLAQYQQPAFDQLAFDGAKDKLVNVFGYPKELLQVVYDHEWWARGLIIDTERGNFLKIDRHKYVRVAYHGFDPISSTTRKDLYSKTFNKVASFSERSFVNMDTLFQFVDAHLFAALIDMKDKGEYEVLDFKTYDEIYKEIRECVDLCHRDGVIKDEVAINPEKYIVLDNGMIPMLKRYRDAGVKVFLLTNSLWEYTSVAMNYLYHGEKVDEETMLKNEWLDLFDLAIVGSCKPAYMLDPKLSLFRVRPDDGSLLNTDGLFEIDALGPNGAELFLQQGKVFQGGNWKHLQAMLEIDAGEEILYVGDHLYSDVLRSKRTLGWRSAFIMPELEEEMRVFNDQVSMLESIKTLRKLRDDLNYYADMVKQSSNNNNNNNSVDVEQDNNTKKQLAEIEEDDEVVKNKLSDLAQEWHRTFHPIWGAMFNAGYQDSRFAYYVQNYACLYTSRATNLGLSFTTRSFRTSSEMLPHDKLIADERTEFQEFDPWEGVF